MSDDQPKESPRPLLAGWTITTDFGVPGRWTATRAYAGAEISLTCSTLNALVAACRDFDRKTA
jgi:hypothetical protein